MDYVTRQFISLAKKLRDDLRLTLQKHTDAIGQATKAARENNKNQLPIILPLRAELQIPEADKTEQRGQYDKSHTLQKWLTFGTWLAFIAAAIYAGIAHRQLKLAAEALRVSKEQFTVAQTAAKKSSDDTLAQVQRNFVADQRPYILLMKPEDEIIKNTQDRRLIWNVYFRNYGKSPATRVRRRFFLCTGEHALEKVRALDQIPQSVGSDVQPPNDPSGGFGTGWSEPPITDVKEITKLLNTENAIVVYGRIDYSDSTGAEYWTLFCMSRQSNGVTAFCPHHNEIH